ncbi:MAG: hypothetical protein IPL61_32760 [Myxococcales bacterium]|nr:hypothetical protein [Myxococcales bacterium]
MNGFFHWPARRRRVLGERVLDVEVLEHRVALVGHVELDLVRVGLAERVPLELQAQPRHQEPALELDVAVVLAHGLEPELGPDADLELVAVVGGLEREALVVADLDARPVGGRRRDLGRGRGVDRRRLGLDRRVGHRLVIERLGERQPRCQHRDEREERLLHARHLALEPDAIV